MADKIDPVLSKDEWDQRETWVDSEGPDKAKRHLYASFSGSGILFRDPGQWKFQTNVRDLPKLIALANAALNHSDNRKITRRWVAAIRDAADMADNELSPPTPSEEGEELRRIADALECYLQ